MQSNKKRSAVGMAILSLALAASSSAEAQRRPPTKPIPTGSIQVNVPPPAYSSVANYGGVSGRAGATDTRRAFALLDGPRLVAADESRGLIYVADVGNSRVRVIHSDRVETFATNIAVLGSATGMVVDPVTETVFFTIPSGQAFGAGPALYALRRGAATLTPVSLTQRGPTGVVAAQISGPQGLVRDPQGNLFISGDGKIFKVAPDGQATVFANLPGAGPLARDPRDGSFFVLVGRAVHHVTTAGRTERVAGSTTAGLGDGAAAFATFNDPRGIAVDPAGRIFVSDAAAQPDGSAKGLIRQIAFQPAPPASVAILGAGLAASGYWVSTLAFQGSGSVSAIPVAVSRPLGMTMWVNQLVFADPALHTVDILH